MNLTRLLTLSVFCLSVQIVTAQRFVSTYKPKNQTERRVLAKLKELPEIKGHYASRKNPKPDIIMADLYSHSKYYRFQVGFDYGDRFGTNYYLSIDPKNMQVYFDDFSNDESPGKLITLAQWRKWRTNPGLNAPHKWVKGELVVLKDQ